MLKIAFAPRLVAALPLLLALCISTGCKKDTQPKPVFGECDLEIHYGDPTDTDSDGDGLSDRDEESGWQVNVDLNNDGDFDDDGETYRVSSDPNEPDSDGDCLSDFDERVAAIDPWNPDSDEDLLSDYEEVKIYRSQPHDIDSDNDSISPDNPSGNGHQELRDYQEAKIHGTSPILSDTDGDGISDYEEILESGDSFFDPLVADVPKIQLQFLSSPGIELKGKVSETQSQSWSVERSQSQTDSLATSSTYGSSTSFTSEWSLESTISLDPSVGYSYGESTTTSSMYSYTTERGRETTQAYSEASSSGLEVTNEKYEGEVSILAAIKNSGNLTFTLENLSINAVRWSIAKQEFEAVH